MKDIVQKLIAKEHQIAEEKGGFLLFALFLREDSPGKWDLLVSAPWISRDKAESLKYLASKVQEALTPEELLLLSRIVLIDDTNPALGAVQRAIHVEHGMAEIRDSNFFGLQIKHAYLITSRRQDNSLSNEAP